MKDLVAIEDELNRIGGRAADAMDLLQEMKALAEKMEKTIMRTQLDVEALYVSLDS